jgi:hypothetical protein
MLLYGSKAWATAVEQKRLETMDMRGNYTRMTKVMRTERITNEEVVRRVREKRNILNLLRRGTFIAIISRILLKNSLN